MSAHRAQLAAGSCVCWYQNFIRRLWKSLLVINDCVTWWLQCFLINLDILIFTCSLFFHFNECSRCQRLTSGWFQSSRDLFRWRSWSWTTMRPLMKRGVVPRLHPRRSSVLMTSIPASQWPWSPGGAATVQVKQPKIIVCVSLNKLAFSTFGLSYVNMTDSNQHSNSLWTSQTLFYCILV